MEDGGFQIEAHVHVEIVKHIEAIELIESISQPNKRNQRTDHTNSLIHLNMYCMCVCMW